jgi:hypothetical protein
MFSEIGHLENFMWQPHRTVAVAIDQDCLIVVKPPPVPHQNDSADDSCIPEHLSAAFDRRWLGSDILL